MLGLDIITVILACMAVYSFMKWDMGISFESLSLEPLSVH